MPAHPGEKFPKQRVEYPNLYAPSLGDISEFGRPCCACTEVGGTLDSAGVNLRYR